LSFAAISLCVAPQRVFVVVIYFVIDSVRKLFDTLSYCTKYKVEIKNVNLKSIDLGQILSE